MLKKFNFDYPVINKKLTPVKFFTNLYIVANATIGRQDKVCEVKILKIYYGGSTGSDINTLLQVINSDLYQEIYEAAEAHAIDKYELQST